MENFTQTLKEAGITECAFCAGARNAPIFAHLENDKAIHCMHWPEERSAAFWALGRIKATGKPVAVITTSGTAAAEIYPAIIEAHYSGTPLLAITADRPKRMRQTGAPQAIEQVCLFGPYVQYFQDTDGSISLKKWDQQGPGHVNICIDESFYKSPPTPPQFATLDEFLRDCPLPLVIVNGMPKGMHPNVIRFLLQLKAPTYLEALSQLQGVQSLLPLRLFHLPSIDQLPALGINGILRIGTMPTTRLWRDLEFSDLPSFSMSHLPFSGLSHTRTVTPIQLPQVMPAPPWEALKQWHAIHPPLSKEQSLFAQLLQQIPEGSFLYLGNSLPIRHCDLLNHRDFQIDANRGANGIDGQISTFLGAIRKDVENWGIFGDLTTLYDMAGLWALKELGEEKLRLIIINNGGGRIFERLLENPIFQNAHSLEFKSLAEFWKIPYLAWRHMIGDQRQLPKRCLIEIFP